jgi:hypothetical protein
MSPECQAAVVIPCLNEVEVIEQTAASIVRAGGSLLVDGQVEVTYVDGGSKDGTAEYLTELSTQFKGLHLISELIPGIGHARRTGAAMALSRAARRSTPMHDDFWLISSDSDAVVPGSWMKDWLDVIRTKPAPVITGHDRFPDNFETQYPNYILVFAGARKLLRGVPDLFGPASIDGVNCAIERQAYAAAGPFEQPYKLNDRGNWELLAGEDHDLGARARALGIPMSTNSATAVTVSPRRFECNPQAFLSGAAYNKNFVRVNTPSSTRDLDKAQIPHYIDLCTRRYIGLLICKPILVDGRLPATQEIHDLFGQKLASEISQWLAITPRPDLFRNRNAFMINYLSAFHQAFSDRIALRLHDRSDG